MQAYYTGQHTVPCGSAMALPHELTLLFGRDHTGVMENLRPKATQELPNARWSAMSDATEPGAKPSSPMGRDYQDDGGTDRDGDVLHQSVRLSHDPALFEISSSSAARTAYDDDDAVVSKDTAMYDAGSTSDGGIQCILLASVKVLGEPCGAERILARTGKRGREPIRILTGLRNSHGSDRFFKGEDMGARLHLLDVTGDGSWHLSKIEFITEQYVDGISVGNMSTLHG